MEKEKSKHKLNFIPISDGWTKCLRNKIPNRTGIYLFADKSNKILYVGKALILRNRISSYFQKNSGQKTLQLISNACFLSFIETDCEFTALLLESNLIKKFKPHYNVIHKDDKHYLYIKITVDNEFPKVFTSRKENDPKALYFGPFLKSKTVKSVLRHLRRIFPYCTQRKIGKRACFYKHLKLCHPCPSEIVKAESERQKILKKEYRLNIFRLVKVLSGKYPKVIREMTQKMQKFAKKENFEKAQILRDKIARLEYITTQRYKVGSFIENSAFLHEQREKELKSLFQILLPILPNISNLGRIECFDVSNLFADYAVGSMVVFIDGIQEPAYYRRFRIKTVQSINDTKMMQEIVKRRFAHLDDWGRPNLIVVDGGKGQVSAAIKALTEVRPKFLLLALPNDLSVLLSQLRKDLKLLRLT